MRRTEKVKSHFSHYIPLFTVLAFSVAGFISFSYEKAMLYGIAVGVTSFYLAWGIAHHMVHRDLTLEVFLEYLGTSLVGLVLLISIILNM